MNMRSELHADPRLWRIFGVTIFVLLGFVSLFPRGVEDKAGPSYLWGAVAAAMRRGNGAEVLPAIIALAIVLAVVSAVLGWTAQAVVVAIRSVAAPEHKNDQPPN